jgi:heme A synthase
MTFTKRGVIVLVFSTLLCLVSETIGCFRVYSGTIDRGWKGIIFALVGIVIMISAKSYLPHKPESLKRWLYLLATAFSLKILGELVFKASASRSVFLLFCGLATLFIILSLLAAIAAYKSISATSEAEESRSRQTDQ